MTNFLVGTLQGRSNRAEPGLNQSADRKVEQKEGKQSHDTAKAQATSAPNMVVKPCTFVACHNVCSTWHNTDLANTSTGTNALVCLPFALSSNYFIISSIAGLAKVYTRRASESLKLCIFPCLAFRILNGHHLQHLSYITCAFCNET